VAAAPGSDPGPLGDPLRSSAALSYAFDMTAHTGQQSQKCSSQGIL